MKIFKLIPEAFNNSKRERLVNFILENHLNVYRAFMNESLNTY